MQILILAIVIAWMVWSSKDVWRRAFPSGMAVGVALALFGNDGDTKTVGILLAIACGVLVLLHRLMTK